MANMDESLAFYTNGELVKELLSRATFMGIIIKPRDSAEEININPQKSVKIDFEIEWNPQIPRSVLKKILTNAMSKIGEK